MHDADADMWRGSPARPAERALAVLTRALTFAGLAALTGAVPAAAELVVLAGGGVLKVSSYRVTGERAELALSGGGTLTLDLGRVERIVADEVVQEPEPEAASFALTFGAEQPRPGTPFSEEIYRTARDHDLNPQLLAAMVRAESGFDPQAVSVKGARGLLQLMPATAARFGVAESSLFEPVANLGAGARYLGWLAERFAGELPLILSAYNAGEGMVDRYGGVPPFRETQDYLRRIYADLGIAQEGSVPPARPALARGAAPSLAGR